MCNFDYLQFIVVSPVAGSVLTIKFCPKKAGNSNKTISILDYCQSMPSVRAVHI